MSDDWDAGRNSSLMTHHTSLKNTFGGGDLVGDARVEAGGPVERLGQRLEAGFDLVMVVLAVQHVQVEREVGFHRQRLEEVRYQLGGELAEPWAAQGDAERGQAAPAEIDRRPRQRLVE